MTPRLSPFLRALLVGFVFALGTLGATPRNILFVGDSLTAGYGLPDPATQAYPALIQQKLDALAVPPASAAASASTASSSAPAWRIINAGISGDTTSGGLRRMDWVLRQPVAILVLALGSNDGLRGLDPALVEQNLVAIVAKVRARQPEARVLLVGQRMPTSMGDYAAAFDAVFPRVATKNGWAFVPFLLEGVGGVRDLNQADAIHPNEEGHRRMAATVWTGLEPLLTADPAPTAPATPTASP
jgi:acyl-CoA thioesterase-1